jgi:hypothetical protein
MEWLPKFCRSGKIGMDFAGIIKVAVNFGFTFIKPKIVNKLFTPVSRLMPRILFLISFLFMKKI